MNPFSNLPRGELIKLARSYKWVHSVDLGDFTTPGLWGAGNPEIMRAMGDLIFRGKKVLDIGTWDGAYAFIAEEAGAKEVWATDLVSQRDFSDQATFQVAAALRGSKAKYIPDLSVYHVETLGIRDFDIVIYTGIYYHLKDPLRAFTAIRRVLRDGGTMICEGAILDQPGCFANFYYRQQFCGDNSNWWVPTRDCLRQWVECSFFKVTKEYGRWGHKENQRHCLLAKAIRGQDPLYLRVPEDLSEYARQP